MKDNLKERLRSTKPDEPGWWMIECDDLSFRPAYFCFEDGCWTADWRKGFRFSTEESAKKHAELLRDDPSIHVRSHSMMTGYHNPDGPEAADRIEQLEAALPIFKRVTRLAYVLSCDVPITTDALKRIDEAREALQSLQVGGE